MALHWLRARLSNPRGASLLGVRCKCEAVLFFGLASDNYLHSLLGKGIQFRLVSSPLEYLKLAAPPLLTRLVEVGKRLITYNCFSSRLPLCGRCSLRRPFFVARTPG